ncbi:MAG: S-layer homology domain-containing protein, partial [Firmicutes bacterium]|nr:S-layer homology domain-containing protein [Bacillota bacterium]
KNKKVTKTLDPWDDSVRALISDTYGNNAGAEYVTLEIDGYEEEVAFSEGKAIIRCEDGMCIVKKNATSVKPVTPTETAKPKSFKDVAEARWSHDAIMEMVDLGLFTGMTTPDKNGVASFEPTGTMTVAQFVTVATRILYQDQLDAAEAGQYWYSKNYDVAIANGLIKATEFSIDDMTKNITREQMALIAVRTAAAQGDNSSTEAPDSIIPDIAQADSYYKSFVKYSYAMGLITGMDDAGNFAPKNTLTREQGAMVAYRLIHEEVRQYPVF